ncbi:MAG: APC family permease [Nitrospira sp.]|nr:APC family permease [Nitrospira sp.]MCP9441425.1 APC family permease [Nitrospira sp.]
MLLKRWLVGDPLKTTQAKHERLSKTIALAVFSSNAISSVAYGTEEILLVLILAGTAALSWSIPVSLAILFLVLVLTISYRQIIYEYPDGGGAYVVAKTNLGERPALVAAAALMIDYILTVAVSIAAGVAAITSAIPGLYAHRVSLGLLAIVFIVIINLRGVRESGKFFAIPTYFGLVSLSLLILVGAPNTFFGPSSPLTASAEPSEQAMESLTLFLILRSFAAGCSTVTGMEVISNGVKSFRPPESKNAAVTMLWMSTILASLFMGISWMAYSYHIVPKSEETVVSQLARLTFGTGTMYYAIQTGTMILLILAANSAFAGFPHLASILAKDGFMPHQMATFGDRLVFSNGIMVLGFFACLLLVVFEGDTHALIPLYAIGVFISFTLSQAGMVKRWLTKKGAHWRKKLAVNGIGACTTGIASVIIASTKFLQGAWIVFLLITVLIIMFQGIRSHYKAVAEQIALDRRGARPPLPNRNIVLIPIGGVNRAVIRAVDFARSRPGDIRAVYVETDPEESAKVKILWAQWGCGIHLVVLSSPYRSVLGSLIEYIEEILEKHRDTWVTVVIPEILPARWWQNILHNQRALMLKAALLFKERVVLTDIPFHLTR